MSRGAPSSSPMGGDTGAVTTIVAVLLSVVFIGFLALTVDVGRTVLERRELQNGADAGALALAQDCADGHCGMSLSSLEALVNANADDGRHEMDICGTAPGLADIAPGVQGCDPDVTSIENIRQCPPIPESLRDVAYVEVRTRTGGDFTSIFGAAAGAGNEASVATCARAMWGSPVATGETLALAIGLGDWCEATADDPFFAPGPPYSQLPSAPSTNPATPVPSELAPFAWPVIAHSTEEEPSPCGPSGFGWLTDSDDCTGVFSALGTVTSSGAPLDGSCEEAMQEHLGTEVFLPVFGDVSESGGSKTYTLTGIASFYLAGWSDLPSAGESTYGVYDDAGLELCPSEDGEDDEEGDTSGGGCIWGWFTSPLVDMGTVEPTVPLRGPRVVQLAG